MSAPTDATILENIITAINNRIVGGAVESYAIGDRNLKYMNLTELEKLRDIYQARVDGTTANNTRTYGSFVDPI